MANNSDKAFPVSWDQFHRDCRALTWRLNEVGPFHAVVAITRGGLVPAAIVARQASVVIVNPAGTGIPRAVISARPTPFPPRSSRPPGASSSNA